MSFTFSETFAFFTVTERPPSWTTWSSWSGCVSVGRGRCISTGTRTRSRKCTNGVSQVSNRWREVFPVRNTNRLRRFFSPACYMTFTEFETILLRFWGFLWKTCVVRRSWLYNNVNLEPWLFSKKVNNRCQSYTWVTFHNNSIRFSLPARCLCFESGCAMMLSNYVPVSIRQKVQQG